MRADRKLRFLFMDFNSFFAACEQAHRPELRGKPVGVAPLYSETTSIVAASVEAKRAGVKGMMMVAEARRICPDIIITPATFGLYRAYHEAIQEAAQRVLPIDKVYSIDEMCFRLLGEEREPENALKLARRMKEELRKTIGPVVTCSIGLAPNRFLGKVATEMKKPDGLVTILAEHLPDCLYRFKLRDFPGINVRMERRLNAALIFTTEQLCRASREELLRAFGSIYGERWWYMLRGYDLDDIPTHRGSLGHSHVLPPELRNERGAREVLLRLLQKASARLRQEDLFAERMWIGVSSPVKSWYTEVFMPPTQDTMAMNEKFRETWERRDFVQPKKVSVTLTHLRKPEQVTPSLFDDTLKHTLFNRAVDSVNRRFGKNKIYLAGMHQAKDTASEKIAFNKVELFSEGKGDNDWRDRYHDLFAE